MTKISHLFFMMMSCVFLFGCQNVEENKPKAALDKEVSGVASVEEEFSEVSYSLVGEEIEKEPEGELFTKHLHGKELASDEEYGEALEEAMNEYIAYIEKADTNDWDAQKWTQSIVTSLRTNHGSTIQPIKKFNIIYEELKLPDGRLLQDVTEEELNQKADPVDVAVLLDASGSMKADVEGGNKMELAKASLKSFTESLPDNVDISLSVFGHKGTSDYTDRELSCKAIETVYPLQPYNEEEFSSAMNTFEASGWTPLAATIEKAEKDLLEDNDEKRKSFIYVISDGIETCDGDPVAAAKNAKASVTNLQINIIGFDVDDEADRQLKEVAEAGGGEYSSAQNKQQLDDSITKSWKENIGQVTWMYWNVNNTNDINWSSVNMSNKLRELQNDEITARNRELERMKTALNKLEEIELIDSNLKSEILDLLYERTEIIKKYAEQIIGEKHDEIFDTADRLKNTLEKITDDLDL